MRTPTTEDRIICATDFSEQAQHAADVAALLARKTNSQLVLMHGINERGEIPHRYWRRMYDAAGPLLSAEAKRLRDGGADVKEQLAGGMPEEGVVNASSYLNAGLMVLGSSGSGTLTRWMLGSTAERIAESAPFATLLVRDPAPFQAWTSGERPLRIQVGVDFTPVSDAALRGVANLQRFGPCEVTLVFVDRGAGEHGDLAIFDALELTAETAEARAKNEDDLREKAERWLGAVPAVVRVTPGSTRIDTHLLDLAKRGNADLIAVGTHQWHGLDRLRHGSVSRSILRHAETNVLCVPSAKTTPEKVHLSSVGRILVAADLTDTGGQVIPQAYSILRPGGTARVLHVARAGEERSAVEARLRAMIPVEAAERGIQTDVEIIESRDVAAGICEAADRFDADLICVSSHASTGAVAAMLGSVAHEVIKRSSRPVLVGRGSSS